MCSSKTLITESPAPPTNFTFNTHLRMGTDSMTMTPINNAPSNSPPAASNVGPLSIMTSPNPAAAGTVSAIDHYRLQLYNYAMQAERLRLANHGAPVITGVGVSAFPPAASPYGVRWPFPFALFHNRMSSEEPKPQHSYIGLIAMAILSSPETKLVLSDIYQYILDNYPYFRTRGPGWRNSIRHNLSLNDCFVKAGRSANGKGHFWAIHPANIDDFKKGDFRRRKAQRKVRKHMGLAVEDDGNDSPSPPPLSPPPHHQPALCWAPNPIHAHSAGIFIPPLFPATTHALTTSAGISSRKRQFDMASLLAPDDRHRATSPCGATTGKKHHFQEVDTHQQPQHQHQNDHHTQCSSSSADEEEVVDIDVVTDGDSNPRNRHHSFVNGNGAPVAPFLNTAANSSKINHDEDASSGATAPRDWSYSPSALSPSPAAVAVEQLHQQHQQQQQQQQLHQQNLVARYYEQLNQARTIQLYQQLQMHQQQQQQKRFVDMAAAAAAVNKEHHSDSSM